MDHPISEMLTYFDPNNEAVMSFLLYVLPALLVYWEGNPVQAALQYYDRWLTITTGFWRTRGLSFGGATERLRADQDLPSSAIQALENCDNEFFLNIMLLPILCTLPITSVECEGSFSTLRLLKTHLKASHAWCMTSERECTFITTSKLTLLKQ